MSNYIYFKLGMLVSSNLILIGNVTEQDYNNTDDTAQSHLCVSYSNPGRRTSYSFQRISRFHQFIQQMFGRYLKAGHV